MTPADFTKEALDELIGENYEVGTKGGDTYDGEISDVTDTVLTMLWFNIVKDQVRELDIPIADISWIKESL